MDIPVFIVLLIVIYIIFLTIFFYKSGYRQGQIDALNGKVEYEKKENEDGEITWVKK